MIEQRDLGPDPIEKEAGIEQVVVAHVLNEDGAPHEEFNDEAPPASDEEEVYNEHDMVRAVGVQFKPAGRIYEFRAPDGELPLRSVVISQTESGPAMGEVIRLPRPVPRVALPRKLYPVIRMAEHDDFHQRAKNRELEFEILRFTTQLAARLNLAMKVVRAEVFHSGKKAVVYFSCDDRVDFRIMVKDLVGHFRLRIELRQIGSRDAAKMIGGIGDCGRELCCSSWLRDFAPVSIRMAKNQGLALNPRKISGQCGKLKCCLAYEDDVYRDSVKRLPRIGKKVTCSSGFGTVTSQNILKQEITVMLEDGTRVTLQSGNWEAPQQQGREPEPPVDDADDSDAGDDGVDA